MEPYNLPHLTIGWFAMRQQMLSTQLAYMSLLNTDQSTLAFELLHCCTKN